MITLIHSYQVRPGYRVNYTFSDQTNSRLLKVDLQTPGGASYSETFDFSVLGPGMNAAGFEYDTLPEHILVDAWTDDQGNLFVNVLDFVDNLSQAPPDMRREETLQEGA